VDALQHLRIDLVAVHAEQDQLGFCRARLPQQVDSRAVAIIDLGTKLAGDVDHLDIGVDQRDGDVLRQQHLPHRLAEAPIANDDRIGAVRRRAVARFVLGDRFLAEPLGRRHQERRRRHRQRDDRAEQARRLGCDQEARLRLREQHEAELAALAQQQP